MTKEFLLNCYQNNPLFEATFTLMTLGKTPEKYSLYLDFKPLLSQLDCFINYNINEHLEQNNIPLLISYSTNPEFRKVFIEYLVIRLGVMSKSAIGSIEKEDNLDKQRGGAIIPSKDESLLSKTYFRRINFLTERSERNGGKMYFGDASRLFRKKALSLSKGCSLDEIRNIIICREQDLPDSKDSLLMDYYTDELSNQELLFCNHRYSGTTFFDELENKGIQFDINNPTHANIYLLYSNTEQADFFQSDIELLSQIGLQIDNLFIFALNTKPYCLNNLRRDLNKFQAKYTNNIFFFNEEETAFLSKQAHKTNNQLLVGENEDFNTYGLEVQNIIEDMPYSYNLRNIIGLCATARFEELFFDFVQQVNPDYNFPESTEVFDYMRFQWEETIIPQINSFANECPIAFVIDWKTPTALREEIASLFPGLEIQFRTIQDLKPQGDNPNSIAEHRIVVLRYTGFKENDVVYPNSYEPYSLRDDQELLEIIPLALFAEKRARTKNNLARFYNSIMQNGYRTDCLGWTRQEIDSLTQYAIERDEDDDYRTPERDLPRVIIKYDSGRESTLYESTPIIYKENGIIRTGRLSDIIDEYNGKEIQLIDELENHLGVLVNKSENKDSDLEKAQRTNYEKNYGIANNPNVEIWRLLLMKAVEDKGKEAVYSELITRIEKFEKKPKEIIDRWIDSRITNLILPRRKKTKNIVFEYLGIPSTSPYRGIIYRKKMRTIQFSMERNRLLDQVIYAAIRNQIIEGSYSSLYSQIPEALDLLDVTNDADLQAIKQEIIDSLSFSKINKITPYGE